MKNMILSLIAVLASSYALADVTQNWVCTAPNVRVTVTLNYKTDGTLTGSGSYDGVDLKLVSSKDLPVLSGFTGDTDNNSTYQITMIDNNSAAVLLTDNNVDRVGPNHSETDLDCRQH